MKESNTKLIPNVDDALEMALLIKRLPLNQRLILFGKISAYAEMAGVETTLLTAQAAEVG